MNFEYATASVKAKKYGVVCPEAIKLAVSSWTTAGWDIVNTIPLLFEGYTQEVVFILKRPAADVTSQRAHAM